MTSTFLFRPSLLTAAAVLLACAARCNAQLGETLEQIKKTPAFADDSQWSSAPAHPSRRSAAVEYTHSDRLWTLDFSFLAAGGPAVKIEFRQRCDANRPRRIENVRDILAYNGGLQSWVRVQHDSQTVDPETPAQYRKAWRRSDGARAYYRDPDAFVLEAPAAIAPRVP